MIWMLNVRWTISWILSVIHLKCQRRNNWVSVLRSYWVNRISMLNAQCSILNAQCSILYGQCSVLYGQCSMLKILYSMLYALNFIILYTQNSKLYALCSMLYGQCSMLYILCSIILYTQCSMLNAQCSMLYALSLCVSVLASSTDHKLLPDSASICVVFNLQLEHNVELSRSDHHTYVSGSNTYVPPWT